MILGSIAFLIVLLNVYQLLQFVSWMINELLSPVETERVANRMMGQQRNEALRAQQIIKREAAMKR
jgi:hypothetical protein